MALIRQDKKTGLSRVLDRGGPKIPSDVDDRIKRGRDRMYEDGPKRDECMAFWRGDQYVYVQDGSLARQSTVRSTDGSGKPAHRIRRRINLIAPVIGRKVSGATSRIPGYEINPSTVDPEDQSAARLGQKIARIGYNMWNIRRASVECVTYALTMPGGGFAWPYFDTSVGPFEETEGEDGKVTVVGRGEIKVRTFGANEVFWEPGVSFHESSWYGVEQARTMEEVKALAGFVGGDLRADAVPREGAYENRKSASAKLVMTTDYLERPCSKYPYGRWITVANDRVIVEEREYPVEDQEGNVVDEPVLHPLTFICDPDSDRDMCLVEHLIDGQRAWSHASNKQAEWVQLALNPQVIIKNGRLREQLNDVPGAKFHYQGTGDVAWREVPPIPPELQQVKDDVRSTMQFIAADQEMPPGLEAASAIEAADQLAQAVWQEFYGNVADFHSSLMKHCLMLVQVHYDDPRLMQFRGRFGVESINDFRGADLRGQTDVVVHQSSVEPQTRQAIESKILAMADRGWISPEAAMAALNGGTAEALAESYELDVSRAHRVLQRIASGADAFLGQMNIADPMSIPNWMPREFDNIRVWKTVFEDYQKTEDFEMADPVVQEAVKLAYQMILQLEALQMAREQAMQAQVAMEMGMANATRPSGPQGPPDSKQPKGGSTLPTQNQPGDQY